MTTEKTKTYWAQAQKQTFLKNNQECWQQLGKLVSEVSALQAKEKTETQLPFATWWQSCFELLAPFQVKINQIHYRGNEASPEYIELLNDGPAVVDLSGWKVTAGIDKQKFIFPEGTSIQPGEVVKVYTGGKHKYSFGFDGRQIWNNKGDTGCLFNAKQQLISAWSYGNDSYHCVDLTHIEYDGQQAKTEADEYAEIRNNSDRWVDIAGWVLSSNEHQTFRFHDKAKIPPSGTVRVYTNQIHEETGGFSFGSATAIWNNKGDSAVLSDPRGNPVSHYEY